MERGKDKKPRKRYVTNSQRVISMIDLNKSESAKAGKTTNSIVYPPPPSYLNTMAKAEWKRMIRKLHELNRFEELDGLALALYCQTYAEFVTASEELKKPNQKLLLTSANGGGRYRNPWADIQKAARKEMSQYLALFGLSPYDRARIKSAEPEKPGALRNEPSEYDGM